MIVIIIILVVAAIGCLYFWYTSQTKIGNTDKKHIEHNPTPNPVTKSEIKDKQKMVDDYINKKMEKGEYNIVDVESAENPHQYNITLKIDYKEVKKTMSADDIIKLHEKINMPAPDHIAG